MTGMQLTASLFSSLAWPLVVFASVYLLRRPLTQLVSSRLTTVEAFGVRAEFARLSNEVRAETKEAATEAQINRIPSAQSEPPTALPTELAELAETSPKQAILQAYDALIDDLRQRVGGRIGEEGLDRLNPNQLAGMASSQHIITESSAESVRGLGVMRNLAAYGQRLITAPQALEYLSLVDGVLYTFHQTASKQASESR